MLKRLQVLELVAHREGSAHGLQKLDTDKVNVACFLLAFNPRLNGWHTSWN
jgi:hypothetical protein